jgi:hypothetical protein
MGENMVMGIFMVVTMGIFMVVTVWIFKVFVGR